MCNYGKSVFLVRALHAIGNYFSRGDRGVAAKKSLVETIQQITLVQLKRQHINTGQGTPLQKYQKIKVDAVRSKVAAGETGPWIESAQRYFDSNRSRVPAYKSAKNSI